MMRYNLLVGKSGLWVLGGHYHFQLQHTDEAGQIVAITLTINYP